MFSHVHIGISDFARAFGFYEAVLAPLGCRLRFAEPERGWAGWMGPGMATDAERPLLLIGRPFDGGAADPGRGQMVALLARVRADVDACHAAAMAAGGVSEGEPGLRPQYHAQYYGAYFRDLDGNKLGVCSHGLV